MLRDITNLPPAHGASGLSLSPLHRLAHISLTSPSIRPRTQSTRADFKHADSSGDEEDDDAKYSSGDESSDDAADSSVDDDTDGSDDDGVSGTDSSSSDEATEEKKAPPRKETASATATRKKEEAERKEYERLKGIEEKEGWRTESSRIQPHPFRPPSPSTLPDNTALQHCRTALEFFHFILPLSFIDDLVEETNRYAEERIRLRAERRAVRASTRRRVAERQHQRTQHQHRAWTPTTRQEFLAFLGCVVYMGIVNIGHTKAYWEGATAQPFVTNVFPRERFEHVWRNFHICNDQEGQAGISLTGPSPQTPDRLRKIRPLIEAIRKQSIAAHYPSQHVSVDEAMIGYKGKTIMRQHIASKRQNTGFKMWTLAECTTQYIYTFEIYTGKGPKSEVGQGSRIVKQLVGDLFPHCHHVVCTHGFFSSVELWQWLHSQGFYAVSTTRNNRKHFPKTLLYDNRNLERGEFVFRQQGDLTCVSWMDDKPVNLLSTYCNVDEIKSVHRRVKKQQGKVEVSCPEVVVEYHRWMRGVDLYAQKEAYFRAGRRARKWWPRLAWFLIGMAISNAHILFVKHTGQKVSQRRFRELLMVALVGGFTARKKRGRPPAHPRPLADTDPHVPHVGKERPCSVCATKMQRSHGVHKPRTTRGCQTCGVAVHDGCWLEHLQDAAVRRHAPTPAALTTTAVSDSAESEEGGLWGSVLRAVRLR